MSTRFCAQHKALRSTTIGTDRGDFAVDGDGRIRGLSAEDASYFKSIGWDVGEDSDSPMPIEEQQVVLRSMNERLTERLVEAEDAVRALQRELDVRDAEIQRLKELLDGKAPASAPDLPNEDPTPTPEPKASAKPARGGRRKSAEG